MSFRERQIDGPIEPIDPAAADRAARQLVAEHGIGALMEAERRILQANAGHHVQQAAFWQQVSRVLQSPGFLIAPLL